MDRHRPRSVRLRRRHRRGSQPDSGQTRRVAPGRNRYVHPLRLPARGRIRSVRPPRAARPESSAQYITSRTLFERNVRIGWQGTIVTLGAAGFVCLAFWLALPLERMANLSEEPPALPSAAPKPPVLRDRLAWSLAGAKFLTDQAWWFMLFWLPDFFHRRFHLDMRELGPPVATVYAMATLGSLSGGALPVLLAHARLSRSTALWVAMAIFAACVSPLVFILHVEGLWPSVCLVGLALAGHQGFATNIFGISAAVVPASRVASVVGLGAFAGNCGGALSLYAAGRLLPIYGLQPSFYAAAAGYPLAWLLLRSTLRK